MELTGLPFSFARLLLVASVQRPPEPEGRKQSKQAGEEDDS